MLKVNAAANLNLADCPEEWKEQLGESLHRGKLQKPRRYLL